MYAICGHVNCFSHIIKFKVHPSVKDTFRSPELTVAMPGKQGHFR